MVGMIVPPSVVSIVTFIDVLIQIIVMIASSSDSTPDALTLRVRL